MNRGTWHAFPALAAFAVVASLFLACSAKEKEEPWTTRSPEALEELEAGIDDMTRLYWTDAVLHFYRALELDPAMAAPKVFLLMIYPPGESEHERLMGELEKQDLDVLSERERFLVGFWRDRFGGEPERAREILASYLAQHPGDPFALSIHCEEEWDRGDWRAAEACYRRLIDEHPNRVDAQSRLGYLFMAQGKFEAAEERFRTYRFIAPDQAGPHDALAELQALVGRYEEADVSLEKALAIKDDFCSAHVHRIGLRSLQGMPEEAAQRLARLEPIDTCHYLDEFGYYCGAHAWLSYLLGDWDAVARYADASCLEKRVFDLALHRVALHRGDFEEALRIEAGLDSLHELVEENDLGAVANRLATLEHHMIGTRLWVEGDPAACEEFAAADAEARYWNLDLGVLKLFNRRHWLRCLEAVGREAEAEALRREIDAVNPLYLANYRVPELPSPLVD